MGCKSAGFAMLFVLVVVFAINLFMIISLRRQLLIIKNSEEYVTQQKVRYAAEIGLSHVKHMPKYSAHLQIDNTISVQTYFHLLHDINACDRHYRVYVVAHHARTRVCLQADYCSIVQLKVAKGDLLTRLMWREGC